jgi:hypothetical protein
VLRRATFYFATIHVKLLVRFNNESEFMNNSSILIDLIKAHLEKKRISPRKKIIDNLTNLFLLLLILVA